MRGFVCVALGLLVSFAAEAGLVQVRIETAAELRDPFLVMLTGHYADLHNGYSRSWKHVLVPAGQRRSIHTRFVNPILNMGVTARVYHPEYVAEAERSRKKPFLIRSVSFPDFRPRTWRDVMESEASAGEIRPVQHFAQVVGHLQYFLLYYLPAMDEAASDGDGSEESLRAYLPFFDELSRFATRSAESPESVALTAARAARGPEYARSARNQELEQRAAMDEHVRRAHAWLSIPREDRQVVRRLMEGMRYTRSVDEELMTDHDQEQLGAFLEHYWEDREARRDPKRNVSWTNPDNRVQYRVHIRDPRHPCSYLSVTADLTAVVSADLGDMTKNVKGLFCRRAPGVWRYGRP